MANRSIMIGIGGDSGAGKHTTVAIIEDLLGKENVTHISGDDYHKWERAREEWETHTHLQPEANFLDRQLENAKELLAGKIIFKPVYDHKTGVFTKPVETKPNKYIIFSGLHPFWLPAMRELFDFKIFLNPDENLRWHWKIVRDIEARGYTMGEVISVLRRRERDAIEYITSQAQYANLVVSCHMKRGIEQGRKDQSLNIHCKYLQRGRINLYPLAMALRDFHSVEVQSWHDTFSDAQTLDVGGYLTKEQIDKLMKHCIESGECFLPVKRKVHDGYLGLFQVLFLMNIRKLSIP